VAKPVSELAGLGEPPLRARHAEGGLVQAVQDPFGGGPGEGVNDIMHDIPAALQPGGIGWYLLITSLLNNESDSLRLRALARVVLPAAGRPFTRTTSRWEPASAVTRRLMSSSAGLPDVAMPGSLAKGRDKAGLVGGAHAAVDLTGTVDDVRWRT
jgi:hypothetical protein